LRRSSTTHTGASGRTCVRRRPAGTSFSRHGRHVTPRRPVPHRATAGTPGLLAVIRLAASTGVESSSQPRAACVAVPRAESPRSSRQSASSRRGCVAGDWERAARRAARCRVGRQAFVVSGRCCAETQHSAGPSGSGRAAPSCSGLRSAASLGRSSVAPQLLLVRNARDCRRDRRGCSAYERGSLAPRRRVLAEAQHAGDRLTLDAVSLGVDGNSPRAIAIREGAQWPTAHARGARADSRAA
jgi:hypothetical protein